MQHLSLARGKQPPIRLLARCCSKGEPEGQEAALVIASILKQQAINNERTLHIWRVLDIHIWYNRNVQERGKWIPSPSCSLFLILDTLFQSHDHSVQQVNHRETKADQQLSSLIVRAIELYLSPFCSQHWVLRDGGWPSYEHASEYAQWHIIIFILQLLQKMELNRSLRLTIWMNLLHITFLSPLQKKANNSRQKWLDELGKTAHSGYPTVCIQFILILSNTGELSFICRWSTTSQL